MKARWIEQIVTAILDGVVFASAFWLAILVRYGTLTPEPYLAWGIIVAPFVGVLCLLPFGFYREVIRFVGPKITYRCGLGVSLATLILLSISFLIATEPTISRVIFLPFWMASVLGVVGVRLIGRSILRNLGKTVDAKRRVLIYGAGEAGVGLMSMVGQDPSIHVVCFVDDDQRLSGRDVRGVRVHQPEQVEKLVAKHGINTIMLALPSAGRARRKELIEKLSELRIEILTVPDLRELQSGLAKSTDLRPIEIEDLLGRESVSPQQGLLTARIKGRTVLVTGAGGSIGSELCRQIITLAPERLILVDNSEFNLYQVESLLADVNRQGVDLVPVLADVCDGLQMRQLMQKYRVATVYHAAAYKHVPIVENNGIVGVRNNVLGTLRTAEAAVQSGVRNFLLISTDKAVRPTSVMGASKRLAELVLQAINDSNDKNASATNFCMVRFGNVLGSSGSVVPKFSEQIAEGGPVTVTHPEVTRYFMTIHEAANLVIQASSLAAGGDVFVLDMGEPVRIASLATRMIDLAGYSLKNEHNPGGTIEVKYTGLRPGEKLYEELLIDGDLEGTIHPKIMRSAEQFIEWDQLQNILHRLEAAIDRRDDATVLGILRETVSGYQGTTDQPVKKFS